MLEECENRWGKLYINGELFNKNCTGNITTDNNGSWWKGACFWSTVPEWDPQNCTCETCWLNRNDYSFKIWHNITDYGEGIRNVTVEVYNCNTEPIETLSSDYSFVLDESH